MEFYKEDDDIHENSTNKQFMQLDEKQTIQLSEEDYEILNQIIVEYITEKQESSDSTDDIKNIYHFLKDKKFIRKNDLHFHFSFLEFHPIYNDLIVIFLQNIANPTTLKESEISFKCLFCFCSSKEICNVFIEHYNLVEAIIVRAVEQDLPEMIYFIRLLEYVSKNINDYSIFINFDISVLQPYFNKPLIPENRWTLSFLFEISKSCPSEEFQSFFLDNVIEHQLTTPFYTDINSILFNIIRSDSFSIDIFRNFFIRHYNDNNNDLTFFAYPFQSDSVIIQVLPCFAQLYSLLIVRDNEFAQYLPIIESINAAIESLSEQLPDYTLKNSEILYFGLIFNVIANKVYIQEVIKKICLDTFHIIQKYWDNASSNFKIYFFKLLTIIVPQLLPDMISCDEIKQTLEFLSDAFQILESNNFIILFCTFLCIIYSISVEHGLTDLQAEIHDPELIGMIYDYINESNDDRIQHHQAIISFQTMFPLE